MASIGTLWGSIGAVWSSIDTLWVIYGIHRDPMGHHMGCIGSIGTLWVMYGIHRDPMGLCRDCIGSIGALRSWGWGYMCSIGTLWGSVGAV